MKDKFISFTMYFIIGYMYIYARIDDRMVTLLHFCKYLYFKDKWQEMVFVPYLT